MTFIFTDEPITSIGELLEQKVVYITKYKIVVNKSFFSNWNGATLYHWVESRRFKKYQEVKM